MILKSLLFSALFYSLTSPLAAVEIAPQTTELSADEKQLVSWIESKRSELLMDLEIQVEINTSTDNIAGLDNYRTMLAKQLSDLGFSTERISSEPIDILSCAGGEFQFADHLLATREGSSNKRIFLNGHMDTVFPAADEFQAFNLDAEGTITGPGVADMKGGLVIMLYALKALHASGKLEGTNLTVFLNSDEEIGSLASRKILEKLALEHHVGLVFEGSANNVLTRARKGLGQLRLKVTGRESHAGASHQQGVSANLELAHKIIAIEKLTDYERGITVNTGVMGGGEKRNTIPGCADAYIDMRFPNLKEGEWLLEQVREISAVKSVQNTRFPKLPTIELWAKLHRPAKEVDSRVDNLIAQAMGLSQVIGEPIVGVRYSGGGTDGSITQAMGLPTLDSLGVDGSGAHTSREKTTVNSLIARSKLAAVMISRLIDSDNSNSVTTDNEGNSK